MLLINPNDPIIIGVKGFHKWELVHRFSGKRKLVQDFKPNILLTSGRNTMSTTNNWLSAVQVGTNNTTPVISNTGLLGYITGSTSLVSGQSSFGAQGTPTYYGWNQRTYRIDNPLIANENIKEAGFGPSAADDDTLISRVLVVNDLGVPTVVTPLPDEMLDITYQMRYYPPLIDVTGQVTLDGILYDYIVRAAEVTNGGAWGQNIGSQIGQYSATTLDWAAYDGDLGTLEQSPSGISAACDNANQSNMAYSNNSYEQQVLSTCGPTGWIPSSDLGIRSIRIKTTAGWFQTQFNAVTGGARIPKTIDKVMQMVWKLGWVEKVL